MDPISAIVAALVAGAVEAAKPTAAQAVKDAYEGFKALIARKFSRTSTLLQGIEERPTSESRQSALKEELADAGADRDAEVSSALQNLINTLRQYAPQSVAHLHVTMSGGINLRETRSRARSALRREHHNQSGAVQSFQVRLLRAGRLCRPGPGHQQHHPSQRRSGGGSRGSADGVDGAAGLESGTRRARRDGGSAG
jgi:hypothetical protein